MTRLTPTRQDHQKFCETEGWTEVRSARGRTGTHHITYELALPDGRILRTRISRPPDRTDISIGLFKHILRDQLDVSVDEFWECVDNGTPPDRGGVSAESDPLPPEIVHLLATKVGLHETEIRQLSKPEAVQILNDYWTHGTRP